MCDPVTMGLGMAASAAGGAITRNSALSNAQSQANARNGALSETISGLDNIYNKTNAPAFNSASEPSPPVACKPRKTPGSPTTLAPSPSRTSTPLPVAIPRRPSRTPTRATYRTPSTSPPTGRRTQASSEAIAISGSTRTLPSKTPPARLTSATAMPRT